MCKNASQRMTFFTEKALTLEAFFFCRWAPDTCSDKSLFSQSTLWEEGGKSPGVLNLSCDSIPNISFFEMQTWLGLQYKERAADLIWGAFPATLPCPGQDTVLVLHENRVSLTSTSAPKLKHSRKKGQKIHQIHDDPRSPRKNKKKRKKKQVGFFVCLFVWGFFCYQDTKINVLCLHWWFLVCPLPAMEWAPKKGSEQKNSTSWKW